MAIKFRKNIYNGVNAHLHSSLQNEDSAWEVFHSSHITHIATQIDKQLPQGYIVEPERSLQIREYHPTTGEPIFVRRKYPKPDITIYETESSRAASLIKSNPLATAPTLTLPAIESIEDDEDTYLRAVIIRELQADGTFGKAVTWIELLSPTNKPPGEGYIQYREKRTSTLHSGIVLVEIDYLHQTRSPIKGVNSYPDRENDSFAYSVVVTNPQPDLQTGKMETYGLHVDQNLPLVEIPLSKDNKLTFDFGKAYNETYESLQAFSYRVDYEQLPIKFDTYNGADQKRILAVMERAKTIAANSHDE
jgi:hypothetical protein